MLDLELIRRNPELVRRALGRRYDKVALEPILELDVRRREYIHKADGLRARRNQVSGEMRLLHTETGKMDIPTTKEPQGTVDEEIILVGASSEQTLEKSKALRKEMRYVGEQISQLGTEVKNIQRELETLLLALPNIPNSDIPIGADETANVTVRSWSNPCEFDFEPKTHWDLNENLKIIDFQRGVKLSGSRFYALHGMGAKLQRALISWMLDLHTREHGYTEVYLPALVRQEVMEGSGNLPKFIDNLYRDQEDDLWLIPSAEVPLTGLHREEILNPGILPLYYAAYTPCFRREKAAAGRDTRGIKRVHQFDKVELYMFVPPERSDEELERLVGHAEEVLQRLDLAYRVTQLCTGDL
ncbi:serine--tRNA ligase, partial [Dehalococcoidia bacterium]|nr:serine--tRNA ligase [Dehalococcoidia bacterium]